MRSIPEKLRSTTANVLRIDSEKIEKVLGNSYLPKSDNLVFDLNLKKIPSELIRDKKVPTKREILRWLITIFDRFDLFAPSITKGTTLMQDIRRSCINWDSEILETLYLVWKKLVL